MYEENSYIKKQLKSESLYKGYNAGWILSIIAVSTVIIGIGFIVAAVAGVIIGIQEIRQERVASGILLGLFGALSLGIYPLVISAKHRKLMRDMANNNELVEVNVNVESLRKGYNVAWILSIIAISLLILFVGIYVAIVAAYIVAVQEIRMDRIGAGIGYYFAIACSCGIVGIVMASKRRKATYEFEFQNV